MGTLSKLIAIVRVQARFKGITLKIDYSNEAPEQIYNDEERLAQILMNFLSNALKFTMQGEIVIKVYPVETNSIFVGVSDTGRGMSADVLGSLRRIFNNVGIEEGGNFNTKGMGFGLHISSLISRYLGIRSIDVASEHGRGSTFSIILPISLQPPETFSVFEDKFCLEERTNSMNGQQTPTVARPVYVTNYHSQTDGYIKFPMSDETKKAINFEEKKIVRTTSRVIGGFHMWVEQIPVCYDNPYVLVVDDNEFNLKAITSILTQLQVKFLTAVRGQYALDILMENHMSSDPKEIPLMLLDLDMPDMGGIETFSEITKQGIPQLHVVACTAYNDVEHLSLIHI
eukprot:TRINITY_DN13697_c0_g1_i2.p1 TRINITY_DN13697_c0_g1~~TRINITY_DN13697_c0_g1_i2.p1  ORF type:complete len:342 (+),score=42.52 TRINITY_DN13697_c0_g1_i2:101-1126(+)